MNNKIIKYISNQNIRLSNNEKFVAIIGLTPSKNARSPLLWNSAYKKLNKKINMYPLDVKKNKLKKLILYLKNNPNFLGGSVTIPYKENIFKILKKNSSKEAKKITAINCIYRDKKNQLRVTNTDGEASVASLKEKFKKINLKNVLVIGLGGAGKAVSSYFSFLPEINKLYIMSRKSKGKKFAKTLNATWINFQNKNILKLNLDLIINCTSLGFSSKKKFTPLSRNIITKLKKKNGNLRYYIRTKTNSIFKNL